MIRVAAWRPRIETAPTDAALLALMHEYCGAWLPSDLTRLPVACRHCSPETVDEIPRMAVTFKQEALKFQTGDELEDLLHELAGVFGIAAERLRSLRSPWAAR